MACAENSRAIKPSTIAAAVAISPAFSAALPVRSAGAHAAEKRASPHDQTSAVIGGKKVIIRYGRPYKKGRQIFGEAGGALVPYGRIWRTSADDATTLTTEGDLMIGTLRVPKGTLKLSWDKLVATVPISAP